MIKQLICINCPLGCRLNVAFSGDEVMDVSGNFCPRGADYAKQEAVCPMRVLTTLMRIKGTDKPLPVRTDGAIPLSRLFDCKEQLNQIEAVAPVRSGDIMIHNICDTGRNIIATGDFD